VSYPSRMASSRHTLFKLLTHLTINLFHSHIMVTTFCEMNAVSLYVQTGA
jgi:hypothetical protein